MDDYPSDVISYGNSGPLNGLPYNDHNYILNGDKAPNLVSTVSKLSSPVSTVPREDKLSPLQQKTLSPANKPNLVVNYATNESTNIQLVTLKHGLSLLRSPYLLNNAALSLQKNDSIRCICGYTHDDGFLVKCDKCNMNQHIECVSPYADRSVPDPYFCDICQPRQMRYAEAVSLQRQKLACAQQNPLSNSGQSAPLRISAVNGRFTPLLGSKRLILSSSADSPKIRFSFSTQNAKSPLKKPPNFSPVLPTPSLGAIATVRSSKRKQDLVSIPSGHSVAASTAKYTADHTPPTRGVFSPQVAVEKSPPFRIVLPSQLQEEPNFERMKQDVRISDQARVHLIQLKSPTVPLPDLNLFTQISAIPQWALASFEFNNKGLVSLTEIPSNEPIVEYKGILRLADEYTQQYDFRKHFEPHVLFYSNWDQMNLLMDARDCGNSARFIRRSCDPNCEVRHVAASWDDPFATAPIPCVRLVIYASKFIPAHTELSIPFDFDWIKCRYTVNCACNNKNCLVKNMQNKQQSLMDGKSLKRFMCATTSKALAKAKQHRARLVCSLKSEVKKVTGPRVHLKRRYQRRKSTFETDTNCLAKRRKSSHRKSESSSTASASQPIKEEQTKSRQDYWLTEVMNRIERMERKEKKRKKSNTSEDHKASLTALAEAALDELKSPTSSLEEELKPIIPMNRQASSPPILNEPKSTTHQSKPRNRRSSDTAKCNYKNGDSRREDRWLRTQLQRIQELEAPGEIPKKTCPIICKKERRIGKSTASSPEPTVKSEQTAPSLPLSDAEEPGMRECGMIVYKEREPDPMAKFSRSRNLQTTQHHAPLHTDRPSKKRWLSQALMDDNVAKFMEDSLHTTAEENCKTINPKKRYISSLSTNESGDANLPPKKRVSQTSMSEKDLSLLSTLASSLITKKEEEEQEEQPVEVLPLQKKKTKLSWADYCKRKQQVNGHCATTEEIMSGKEKELSQLDNDRHRNYSPARQQQWINGGATGNGRCYRLEFSEKNSPSPQKQISASSGQGNIS
ncbi:myeloid lymphoid or mixed-lineage leukemia 5 (trithorax, ) [Cichlidogyrus casuarinus]|uniref:Myeloid lymphoid or mixed-lineage leukemia 5 (Trithorax, ) n=1 Tax=Cichlidogyrus casuarinus TaxID=1844966 RepID=A0ABD2QLL5_9PLAT